MLVGKVVRVRWVKMYPTAHNHVAVGDVLHETRNCLTLNCKTYHFGQNVGANKTFLEPNVFVGGIIEGEKAIRSIPWSQIEVINELPSGTDWDVPASVDDSGQCQLVNEHGTVIVRGKSVKPERKHGDRESRGTGLGH